jgi:hypothetical protein
MTEDRSALHRVGRFIVVTALAGTALLFGLGSARAHDRTTSYSTWEIRGLTAKVSLRMTLLDATRFPWFSIGNDRPLAQYIAQHLVLARGGTPCAVAAPPLRLDAPPERLVFEWQVTCTGSGALSLRSDLLLDVAPTHLHFARVSLDGSALGEHVFSEAERTWTLSSEAGVAAGDALGTSFTEYVGLGIGHILSGYDHLAFLLALLLIDRRMANIAKVVTGFTIGHSITLALASLGVVHPARGAVDAVIGLSIALVAAEDLWLVARQPQLVPWVMGIVMTGLAIAASLGRGLVPFVTLCGLTLFTLCYLQLLRRVQRPWRLRWTVAFLFGLVHGFGFAGVLVEAELPAQRLTQALLGFNLGVEIGQIAVVLLVWPLTLLLVRGVTVRSRALALEVTSAAVLALGVFWFVVRAYG